MSHGIENEDRMLSGSNVVPWHDHVNNRTFAGRMSPLRCHVEGVGLADVESLPVVVNGFTYPDHKALVGVTQTGNRIPLSIVGADYGVLKDRKVFELLEQVYKGRAVVETAGTLRNCKRLWVLVARDAAWHVTPSDKIESFDLWVNRHDGSGCFELYRTNVRVVCQNTWNMAVGQKRNRVFGIRHTVNVEQGVAQACNLLESLAKQEVEEQRKAIALARTPMSRNEAGNLFASLMGVQDKPMADIPTKTLTALDTMSGLFLRGTGNEGRTRWDAFNAVTEYVDHSRSIRVTGGRSRSESRFESVLMGSGDDMKAKAFDLLTV